MRKELRMIKPEFNLLDEPWIRVRTRDCRIEEVSLKEVFVHAHEYEDLAGETAAQDVAMLRLLLAVLHCTFSRVDENGEENLLFDLEDDELEDEVFRRWKALYDLGHFPIEPIQDYLEQWRERFWLFHEERPFWQVKDVKEVLQAKESKLYPACKLNGELSQSGNKVRLFPVRSGVSRDSLTFAEASRWLVYLNAFDDSAVKPAVRGKKTEEQDNDTKKKKGSKGPGLAWLGKMGAVSAVGRNLFETLLLNLTLLKDGDEFWKEANKAIWEKTDNELSKEERQLYPLPENQAELLTWQSRRLLLERSDSSHIKGYWVLSGDYFNPENAFTEQMTVWRIDPQSGKKKWMIPRTHEPDRQMWREFGSIFCENEDGHMPGLVRWNQLLYRKLKSTTDLTCRFKIVSVQYGDKNATVKDTFSDALAFSSGILTQTEERSQRAWVLRIKEEIKKCELLTGTFGKFFYNVALAGGYSTDKDQREAVVDAGRETCYASLDVPFRRWLNSIDSNCLGEAMEEKVLEWQKLAKQIALDLGRETIRDAGMKALTGKELDKKHYASPIAFEVMVKEINKLYPALRGRNS